jgi:tetratricopeptide (TPR) repeat protein
LALALAAVVLVVFWPATRCDYLHFDDNRYVAENPYVNTGLSWGNLRWAFVTVHEDWWLPLLWISFMLDSALFGSGPFGHHLVNILLHAANAALLFWIVSRMTKSVWASALVAALFALHPLRVEAVAWITARKDVLSGLFFMLAWLAYLRHADRPSPVRLLPVALGMLLGLMSKAILIVLPPILLLLDYWPLQRATALWGRNAWTQWKPLLLEKVPLFILIGVFMAVNMRTHWTGAVRFEDLAWDTRLGLIPPNYWAYIRLLFWPSGLSILYPENDVVDWPVSIVAAAGLLIITLALFRYRRQAPYGIVGWLWFLVALLPVVRGVRGPGIAAYADRFTYLPSIGFFLLVVWALRGNRPAAARRPGLALLAAAGLAACIFQVRAVLPLWKDTRAAFEHVLERAPDYPLAHNNLGAYYASIGRFPEAQAHLERCLLLQPGSIDAHLNLANLRMADGNIAAAMAHYRAVLESNPGNDEALNNLAWLLAVAPDPAPGQCEESLLLALRAMQIVDPPSVSLLDTLSVAQAANGRYADAIRTAEQALRQAQAGGESDLAGQIAQRLAAYRQGLPWRE